MSAIGLDEARNCVRTLALYLGRSVPDDAIERYAGALASEQAEVIGDAFTAWMDTHGPGTPFPSLRELQKLVWDAKGRVASEQKRMSPTWGDVERRTKSSFIRAGCRAIAEATAIADPRQRAEAFAKALRSINGDAPTVRTFETIQELERRARGGA